MRIEEEMAEARQLLQAHFGHADFRKAQAPVVKAALEGDDLLAVLRTGYGKSVCFQIPAMMREGTALVVSPLISLMKDQVDDCVAHGIPASFVNSTLDDHEQRERLAEFVSGAFKLLYIAPERIRNRTFIDALSQATVSFIVCDEAHCTSQWGHDFRPQYSQVYRLLEIVERAEGKRPPVLAVTATATVGIEDSIAESCGLKDFVRIVGDPIRANIKYNVRDPYGTEWGEVVNIALRHFAGNSDWHLVYTTTRNGAAKCAEILEERLGCRVGVYHGGMADKAREEVQNNFKSGRIRIVCATNAFGMGIDVPRIRTVVHMGIPGSLEAYVQETGRAGRDGLDSAVYLVLSEFADNLQTQFYNGSNPPIELYYAVWKYLHAKPEGEVFRLTASKFASALGHLDLSNSVSTVLNVLEKNRLVRREYTAGATPVEVDLTELRQHLSNGALPANTSAVCAALLEDAEAEGASVKARLNVDKKKWPQRLQLSQFQFGKAWAEAKKLDGIFINKTYTGKSTRVTQYGELLEEHLPLAQLEAKAAHDWARLNVMRGYAGAHDRVAYIRAYFNGEPVVQNVPDPF